MLKVQEFLRAATFNFTKETVEQALEGLKNQYAISAKRHPQYPNLVLLKYNQIESPFAEQIVRECRGIILDQDNDWAVVSRAFDKFFNYGEGHAADIDWSSAQVQEKVDGSLCVVYPYDGKWHVATSGSPDAGGDVHGSGKIFRDLFWETFYAQGGELPSYSSLGFMPRLCFYFELTGPDNRIVVVHEKAKLTALGMRDLSISDDYELPVYGCQLSTGIDCVKEFPLQSWEQITDTFQHLSPLTQEGYVVVDGHFNRVKVKHPGYVALHHAKDGMTEKAFVEIVRSGETSEVLNAFPEFKPLMEKAENKFLSLYLQTVCDYTELQLQGNITDKEFAFQAVLKRCPAALFAMRRGKTSSIREFFAGMRIDNLMQLMEKK